MAHSSRHGPRPARPLAGVLRPFPWCSPPGIGFRARPRQLSKQVPPCRSRISAAVFDPKATLGTGTRVYFESAIRVTLVR